MTYDTNEYIFPKVLVLKTLIIQTETFSPQYWYKYPFGEFASFHLFWGEDTKNDDLRRYFHRKSNRWVAVTNILLAEKKARKNYEDKNGWNRGMKKRHEAKQVRRIWTAPPVQVNMEPLTIWR